LSLTAFEQSESFRFPGQYPAQLSVAIAEATKELKGH
jgi:hypothetical protein